MRLMLMLSVYYPALSYQYWGGGCFCFEMGFYCIVPTDLGLVILPQPPCWDCRCVSSHLDYAVST